MIVEKVVQLRKFFGKLLSIFFPRRSRRGARYIVRISDNLNDYFMEWSMHTDSPLSRGMLKTAFRTWYLNKYPNYPEEDLEERMDVADYRGSDNPEFKNIDDFLKVNRAGFDGSCLSKKEIIDTYCDIYCDTIDEYDDATRKLLPDGRKLFLAELSDELCKYFPVLKYNRCGKENGFSPEDPECCQLLSGLICASSLNVSVNQEFPFWVCRIESRDRDVDVDAVGRDEDRNVAFCIATLNWKVSRGVAAPSRPSDGSRSFRIYTS